MSTITQGVVMVTPNGKFVRQWMVKGFTGPKTMLGVVDNLNEATLFTSSEAEILSSEAQLVTGGQTEEWVWLIKVDAYTTRTVLLGKVMDENG